MEPTAKGKGLQVDEPGALGVDKILQQVSQSDEEEWEHEYSATETETYYLTLELSYSDFKDRPTKAPHHSRGGYYKTWLDQYSDSPTIKATKIGVGQDEQSDGDNEHENENENENDDEPIPEPEADDAMQNLDPMLRSTPQDSVGGPQKRKDKGKEREAAEASKDQEMMEELDEIQILDIHSPNPIISYRGKVFEGEWAEVIGTELVFANHEGDAAEHLPALRRLPGDVDMLGASSSRILTTEKTPKPRVPVQDSLAAIRDEWNIRIPPGKDRTGERAQQIRFLEDLMALKKKKGQADEVTVYAVNGRGKDFSDSKGPDFRPRKRRPMPNSSPGGATRATTRRRAAGPSALPVPTPSHVEEDSVYSLSEGSVLTHGDDDDDEGGDGDVTMEDQ